MVSSRGKPMAHALAIGWLLLSSALSLWAKNDAIKARDARLIRQVQEISVSQLDPELLPPVSFEKWLHAEAGADAEFHWEVNDCGEQTGTAADRGRDVPMCVEAQADMKGRRTIVVSIAVGTSKKGAVGKPAVYFAQLVTPATTINLPHLSDLPEALIRTHDAAPPPEIAK
jgi:hypothetical protein